MYWTQPTFWLPAWQIILINILLYGDMRWWSCWRAALPIPLAPWLIG